MDILYTNAPIQNKDFNPDTAVGRIIPIATAEWKAAQEPSDTPRIDLWNNVLASEQKSHDRISFRNQSARRLKIKYGSELLGRLPDADDTITDSDDSFCEWGKQIVHDGLKDGRLVVEDRSMHVCSTCGSSIAISETRLKNNCGLCGSSSTHITDRTALTVTANESAATNLADILDDVAAPNSQTLAAGFEFIINKKRLAGIELGDFGFCEEVLDPKIGLGLLALYAANKHGIPRVMMFGGKSSSHNNIPQLIAFLGDTLSDYPELRVQGIPRAPVGHLSHLLSEGVIDTETYYNAIQNLLPKALLEMKKDMSPATLERMVFSRRNRQ